MFVFEKGIEVGVDGIEFDVQLIKDGCIVVIYDERFDWMILFKGFVKDIVYDVIMIVNVVVGYD